MLLIGGVTKSIPFLTTSNSDIIVKLFDFFFSARLSFLTAVAIVQAEPLVLSGFSTPKPQEDFKITASQGLGDTKRWRAYRKKADHGLLSYLTSTI